MLFVLTLSTLIGIAALALDGGRAYADRRRTQNAADNAALAGAWAICANLLNPVGKAFSAAAENGFDNNGASNTVRVYNPPSQGPYVNNSEYVEVLITSTLESGFSQILFDGELQDSARALAYCDRGQQPLPAMFAGSTTCSNNLQWSGANANVIGNVHSNRDVIVSGANNYVEGKLSYATTIDGQAGKITYNPPPPSNPVQTYPQSYPVQFETADYAPGGPRASAAQASGKYYFCDCAMDVAWLESNGLYSKQSKVLADGLYYATGGIQISATVIGNAVTLVSESTIQLNGANQYLRPYMDDLLAFTEYKLSSSSICSNAVIKFAGSQSDWGGIIYAPNGLLEMSGSLSENANYWGSIIADSIRLSGAQISLQYDPNLIEDLPPKVSLAE